MAASIRTLFLSRKKGVLEINDVIDNLLMISNQLGDYTIRDDLKRAIITLKKILPEWLSSIVMPPPNNKFLLKMSQRVTKQMSPHDCNKKISLFFHG